MVASIADTTGRIQCGTSSGVDPFFGFLLHMIKFDLYFKFIFKMARKTFGCEYTPVLTASATEAHL
jgi:hypothetical protein